MKARMRKSSASIDVSYSEQSGSDETLHSSNSNSKSLDVCVSESRIDRMRKLLSSPLLRRKPNCPKSLIQISQSESKVFGVSLEMLSHSNSSDEPFIPFVITRLCHYIEDSGGLLQEGLFRISGRTTIIDKLKHSFDTTGDANLETEGDIASASALLKLFLRELPQPLIPETYQFLEAIKNYETDEQTCVHNLRALVTRLADENYYTLKYLSSFLNRIALQKENRMTSANLGIVFAPNIFRVSVDNYKGLREQSIANEVVSLFITNFMEIFSVDSAEHVFHSMCPLTVQIPDIGLNTPLSVEITDNEFEAEVPALMLQSTTTQENISNRKRKESKCVSSSPPFRSNSEETLSDSKDKDMRRCSSDENVLNNAFITAVNKFENLNFRNTSSPHPPEPKRRELESQRLLEDSQQNMTLEEFTEKYEFKEQTEQKSNVFERQHSFNEEIHNSSGDLNENFDSSKENINRNENENQNNVLFKTCQISVSSDERNCRPLLEITPTENLNNSHNNNNNNNNNRNAFNCIDKRVNDLKEKIPHLDFKTMYQNSEVNEPILSEHRYSWPRTSHDTEAEHSAHTPSNSVSQFLKKAVSYEAPLSPSAYRSYLSNRNIHLDPTIPPTPPVDQMSIFTPSLRDAKHIETTNTSIRSITKKIQTIKKKIKHFEHEFEKENGFRPSLEQKMGLPEVRIHINQMNDLKKDLKEFKDDLYMEVVSTSESNPNRLSIETKEFNCNKSLINISETIKEIERTIEEKRKGANRPDILDQMTCEEVVEEKLTLQKALLRFEALYGRPSTKAERDIVRPLYDRYRIVKRMVAKTMPPKHGSKDSVELQPILEHIAMDFTSPSHSKSENIASNPNTIDLVVGAIDENEIIISSKTNDKDLKTQTTLQCNNLHEMSYSELNKLLAETRLQKRNLRTVLRDFENEFFKIMGRKVEKEDKVNMGSVYTNYKHTKGKLRLLEALVSKHESQIIML